MTIFTQDTIMQGTIAKDTPVQEYPEGPFAGMVYAGETITILDSVVRRGVTWYMRPDGKYVHGGWVRSVMPVVGDTRYNVDQSFFGSK